MSAITVDWILVTKSWSWQLQKLTGSIASSRFYVTLSVKKMADTPAKDIAK